MRGLRWQDSTCGRMSVEGLMAQVAEPVPVPLGWRGPPGESPWTRLSIRAIWSPSRMAALQCAPDPPNPTVSGRRIGRWAMGDAVAWFEGAMPQPRGLRGREAGGRGSGWQDREALGGAAFVPVWVLLPSTGVGTISGVTQPPVAHEERCSFTNTSQSLWFPRGDCAVWC